MLHSFLVKLLMLAATMGVVFWIGWTVPQSRYADVDRGIAIQTNEGNPLQTSRSQVVPVPGRVSDPSKLQQSTQVSSQPASDSLDLNRATEQEIEALPGIGHVLAGRIVEYRQSRGAFRNIQQLQNVKGIGKKKFERIRTRVHIAPAEVSPRGGRKTT